jgi:aromatic ring-cleaving dioxygenase
MNKYTKWYNQITQNGKKSRELGLERHHILPRSLGGNDDIENITFITPKAHFICHWLLIKIHPAGEAHWKMLNALRMMRAENPNQKRYNTKITSRVYARLKEEYSALQSKKVARKNNPMYGDKFYRSDDGKLRQSNAISGKKNPAKRPEVSKSISEAKIGKSRSPFSEEWKQRMSESKRGEKNNRYGVEVSEETRKLIGDRIRGRKQTEEEKRARGLANLGKIREKKLCPHCQQMIAVNTYPRFHGDSCKEKK